MDESSQHLDEHAEEWFASVEEGHQDGPLSLSSLTATWDPEWTENLWLWRDGVLLLNLWPLDTEC